MALFDVVFARAVLHHTRDLELACREMFRVLRPGGIFVAAREHVHRASKPISSNSSTSIRCITCTAASMLICSIAIPALCIARDLCRLRFFAAEKSDQSVSLHDR